MTKKDQLNKNIKLSEKLNLDITASPNPTSKNVMLLEYYRKDGRTLLIEVDV